MATLIGTTVLILAIIPLAIYGHNKQKKSLKLYIKQQTRGRGDDRDLGDLCD